MAMEMSTSDHLTDDVIYNTATDLREDSNP